MSIDKKAIIIVTTTVCLMFAFLMGFDLDQKTQMKIVKPNRCSKLSDVKNNMQYGIDLIQMGDGIGTINGWAIVTGIDSIDVKPKILLKDRNGNLYEIKTRIVQRKDITKLLNDKSSMVHNITRKREKVLSAGNHVYDNSGITSTFYIKDLNKNQRYVIGIQMKIGKARYFVWTKNTFTLK